MIFKFDMGGYRYFCLRIPRSIHPWTWGKYPSRFYLGPVMFYRRPVVG